MNNLTLTEAELAKLRAYAFFLATAMPSPNQRLLHHIIWNRVDLERADWPVSAPKQMPKILNRVGVFIDVVIAVIGWVLIAAIAFALTACAISFL